MEFSAYIVRMTYNELENLFIDLKAEGLPIFTIGKSLFGQEIYATHTGSYNGKQLIVQGAIHAREWITARLVTELARYYYTRTEVGGIYFIPIMNPDGVRLVLDGPDFVRCQSTRDFLIGINGSPDFSQYKADGNGVDLNTNFDARWGTGAQNVFCPAAESFVGYYPDSEREVNDLIRFTLKNNPAATISYHTKGQVIYYGFEGQSEASLLRDKRIADLLAESTGYAAIKTANSSGGYKDWCIEKLGIPAFTIETGADYLAHPIGEEHLAEMFEENKDVPRIVLNNV